jgi:hypothetical protein
MFLTFPSDQCIEGHMLILSMHALWGLEIVEILYQCLCIFILCGDWSDN